MSQRYDGPLISGALVYGNSGLGVPGSAVPSTGEYGGPPMYPYIAPGDLTKEVRWVITSAPSGLTSFFAYEDGSFTATGPDGTYTIGWDYLTNNAYQASYTTNFTIGAAVALTAASVQMQSGNGAVNVSLPFTGTATATQQNNGNIAISIPFNGSSIAQAIASASLSLNGSMSGVSGQTQSEVGAMSISVTLAGNTLQQAYNAAGLTNTPAGSIALVGATTESQSANGLLSIGDNFAGATITITNATGTLSQIIQLQGTIIEAHKASGGLTVTAPGNALSGLSAQQDLATASLMLRITINAQSLQTAIASGYLTSSGSLIPDLSEWYIAATGRTFKIAANARSFRI